MTSKSCIRLSGFKTVGLCYLLSHQDAFVTTPSGGKLPRNNIIPIFHYIHSTDVSSCCIFSTPANMLSHNNQDHQYGPHGLQYAGCNLLILEMMVNVPHGMPWSTNNCLVDVIRKQGKLWFSCHHSHYMMQVLLSGGKCHTFFLDIHKSHDFMNTTMQHTV